jgi:hypothetical protein
MLSAGGRPNNVGAGSVHIAQPHGPRFFVFSPTEKNNKIAAMVVGCVVVGWGTTWCGVIQFPRSFSSGCANFCHIAKLLRYSLLFSDHSHTGEEQRKKNDVDDEKHSSDHHRARQTASGVSRPQNELLLSLKENTFFYHIIIFSLLLTPTNPTEFPYLHCIQ